MDRYVILLATTVSSFLTPFMASAVNVAIPMIEKEHIKGRKKLFIVGISIFAISALFCSISIDGAMLVVFRFLQGIGSAMIGGTAIAMVTSAVYVGLSSGPFFSGIITQFLGWRAVFAIRSPRVLDLFSSASLY